MIRRGFGGPPGGREWRATGFEARLDAARDHEMVELRRVLSRVRPRRVRDVT